MADSQLILELLFLQRRGGCSLTVLLFFLMLVGTCFLFCLLASRTHYAEQGIRMIKYSAFIFKFFDNS